MSRVVLALALAMPIAACAPSVDTLSVHRFSVAAENQFMPLDRTVNDAAVVSALYDEIRAMPPQSMQSFCPIDFGVRHELSFYVHGDRVLHGVMEMSCYVLDLGAGDRRQFDDRFPAHLLGALGLYTRGNELWPTPIPRP